MRLKSILMVALILAGTAVYAQSGGLSKSEVLNVLTDVGDLGLNSEEEKALESASSKAVDNLFDIADGGYPPGEMNSKFASARDENQRIFKDILGDDNFKKYKKKVKKELKPLKRKAKLVGFLI